MFSNGERTLLKLKISELEQEIKELKKENKEIYKNLVDNAKKDILEFTRKINTQKMETLKGTTSTTKNKKKANLLLKGYTLRKMNDLILDIMANKKAYDERIAK